MRQLLGLGLLAVGGIAVYAAVTGNYKAALAFFGGNAGNVGLGAGAKVWPPKATTTAPTPTPTIQTS
jgi:hypothetical protein